MAITYDVGPDQAFTTIAAVPWASLNPGDVVRIHWQSTPYHEKMAVTRSGTDAEPIRVVGVPGPNGERPVIHGANATTGRQTLFPYTGTQDRGLLVISAPPTDNWGYKPKYVVVDGLEFRGARPGNRFTDASGKARSYTSNAAGIFVERGEHITVRNCRITDNGNGLFVASGEGEELQSRDILVEGNVVSGNGNVGSQFEHNVYTEAVGITFQCNEFGPVVQGAQGNMLKDRSAGTVIRYNRFDTAGSTTGGRLMDLVEPEDSYVLAEADPRFGDTYVYGNVLIQGPGDFSTIVHFGGDQGNEPYYRPRLHFYHNTVSITTNQAGSGGRWRSVVFQIESSGQAVDALNNVFAVRAATSGGVPTQLTLADGAGAAWFGVNWVSPGWEATPSGRASDVRISGTENLVVGPASDPGFVDVAGGDLHLGAGSPAIDRGGPTMAGWPAADRQYVSVGVSESRPVSGTAPDLGAFESGHPGPDDVTPPTVASVVPDAGGTGVATSAVASVTFSEAVRSPGVVVTLSDPAGDAVAGSASYDAAKFTATFAPAAALEASTEYTAKVSGVADLAGNAMADYSWPFTTVAPPRPDDTDPAVLELRRWAEMLGEAMAKLVRPLPDRPDDTDPAVLELRRWAEVLGGAFAELAQSPAAA